MYIWDIDHTIGWSKLILTESDLGEGVGEEGANPSLCRNRKLDMNQESRDTNKVRLFKSAIRYTSMHEKYSPLFTEIEKLIPQWSENPAELINQLETLIRTDHTDRKIVTEQSGGMRLGLKDGLRQLRFQVFRQLFLLDELTKQSPVLNEIALSEHLSYFNDNDVSLIGKTAQAVMLNWKDYVTSRNTETIAGQIACEVYDIVYEYLLLQANTQLGEAMSYDPELIDTAELDDANKLALTKFISQKHRLQQREFGGNYSLNHGTLPAMIQSAIRREELPASESREADERENLQLLYTRMNSPLGTVLVEVSPPYHAHHEQTMVRFYKMTTDGWVPTIFYVPHVEMATADLMQEYFHNLMKRGIEYFPINLNSTVPIFEAGSGIDVDSLANLFPLISRIAAQEYAISGVDVLRAGDSVIKPHIDSVMPSIHKVITEVMNDFPSIMTYPERLDQYTAKFDRLLHSINISLRSEKELKKQGHTQADVDAIKSGRLLKAAETANSDLTFNLYVDKTFSRQLKSELRSDCQNSQAKFGGKNSMGGLTKEMPIGVVKSTAVGKDGTTIKFLDVNGETHIDKCPMCGYRGERHPSTKKHLGIDICNTKCPNCNENMQDMRHMFEKGTLQKYKNEKSNQKLETPPLLSSKSDSQAPAQSGKYRTIPFAGAIMSGLTMGLLSSPEA